MPPQANAFHAVAELRTLQRAIHIEARIRVGAIAAAPGAIDTQRFALHLAAGVVAGQFIGGGAGGVAAGQHHARAAARFVTPQIGANGQRLAVAVNVELAADGSETVTRAIHARPGAAAVLAGMTVVVAKAEHVLRGLQVGQVGPWFRAQHRVWDFRVALGQGRVHLTRVRLGRQLRAQVPVAISTGALEQEVLVLATDGTAGQVELAIGHAADLDQLDALVGLLTGTAHVVDAHVGGAAGVAADDQLVGGRVIAGQYGVEGEGAAVAGEVAGHVEGVEGRAVAEGDSAVAEVEGADCGIAGHVPGGRIQRGAGDVGHRTIQHGAIGEGDIHRASAGVDDVAGHP
ncbi:hypothetical protein G6F31_014480 [Rhizopus arrhizus]|nr:hypothetical protein G6F31_014480 [Rhizopus arrhizus]